MDFTVVSSVCLNLNKSLLAAKIVITTVQPVVSTRCPHINFLNLAYTACLVRNVSWYHHHVSGIEQQLLRFVAAEQEVHLTFEYLGNLLVVMAVHGNSKAIIEVNSSYGHFFTGHDAPLHAFVNGFEFDLCPVNRLQGFAGQFELPVV